MLLNKFLTAFGRYLQLMGRTFSRPERLRMFWRQYIKEMEQLGVNSIAIVLLISFFIGAVICIQIKLNVQSAWMPRWTSGFVTREIMLLEFSSSIMCLILSGKVGSNIASEIGTMRVTQQIDALDIMGVNSASFLILPKIAGLITIMPFLVIFSTVSSRLQTLRLECSILLRSGLYGWALSNLCFSPLSLRAFPRITATRLKAVP